MGAGGAAEHTLAVYATILSTPGDTLTGVSSPDADHATINITLRKGGQASLYPMSDGLILAANQPMLMGPQGTQIRLTGLKQEPKVGQKLTLVLSFARAGTVSIVVPIEASAPTKPAP